MPSKPDLASIEAKANACDADYGRDVCGCHYDVPALCVALREAEAENTKLREALRAITWTRSDGKVYFKTYDGIPMEMPRQLERIARAALSPVKEGE